MAFELGETEIHVDYEAGQAYSNHISGNNNWAEWSTIQGTFRPVLF